MDLKGETTEIRAPWSLTPVEKAERLTAAAKMHEEIVTQESRYMVLAGPTVQAVFDQIADRLNFWFDHQGFSNNDKGMEIALMHSELSEMLEGIRNRIPDGQKGCEAEELADTLIRIFHYAGKYGIDLGAAFTAKMLANYQRPFKHGKEC